MSDIKFDEKVMFLVNLPPCQKTKEKKPFLKRKNDNNNVNGHSE